MRRWLFLLWLLVPIVLASYHFGPGQDALALQEADRHVQHAVKLEQAGNHDQAIAAYGAALTCLPIDGEHAGILRCQLELAQIRNRFQLGYLAESVESLNLLVSEVERDYGHASPLALDVRELLGEVHFQAMVALRLEAAQDDVWIRHWELSRQNYRFLAEHSDGWRNRQDRRNLEVVIKSFHTPPPPNSASSAAASSAITTGLSAPPLEVPPEGAGSAGGPPPPIVDARPRPPEPDEPEPAVSEVDLGS